jgi:hypothetical protein
VLAEDDHGEVGDDLGRRRHGGSIPGRRSSSRVCWRWRTVSMESASTSPACHQVSSSALLRPRVCVMTVSWMRMKLMAFDVTSASYPPVEPPLGFDATAAGLAARPRPASSAAPGRPQRHELGVHADDDNGKEGRDLARRSHGGSIPGRSTSSNRASW